jgi:hypothetical protein
MATVLPETTKALGVPRSVYFPRKLGIPIGRPGQKEEQYSAVLQCLDALKKAKKGEVITGKN